MYQIWTVLTLNKRKETCRANLHGKYIFVLFKQPLYYNFVTYSFYKKEWINVMNKFKKKKKKKNLEPVPCCTLRW
jgi:putative heme iron utilization protein